MFSKAVFSRRRLLKNLGLLTVGSALIDQRKLMLVDLMSPRRELSSDQRFHRIQRIPHRAKARWGMRPVSFLQRTNTCTNEQRVI